MKNQFSCKTLFALTTSFMLFVSPSMAAEKPDYFKVNSHVATRMEEMLVQEQPNKNTVVCPLGPIQILADLYQFADKSVKDEIAKFTRTSFEPNSYQDFVERLPQNSGSPIEVERWEGLYGWIPKGTKNVYFNGHFIISNNIFKLNDERVHQLKSLDATIVPYDFSDSRKAVDYINGIVDTNTNHMIPTILSPDAFSGTSKVMILLSTLYINNSWKNEFEKRDIFFNGPNKDVKKIPGFGNKIKMPYLYKKCWPSESCLSFMPWSPKPWYETTVMIPATGRTSLIIRMRDDGIVTSIDHNYIANFLRHHKKDEIIDFKMPSFMIENEINIKKLFKSDMPQSMGNTPFTVDLFTPQQLVYIGAFIQKNRVEVTKDGLKGASATICILDSICTQEPKSITIDHAFSFAIIKEIASQTWITLFSGEIFDPIAPSQCN